MIMQINSNLNFLTKAKLVQVMQHIENQTNNDIYLEKETNTILGKSKEFYQYTILNKIYVLLDSSQERKIQLINLCIEKLKDPAEKVQVLLEILQHIANYDEEFFKGISLCEQLLSNKEVEKSIAKADISYFQLLLAKIYTLEDYFNSDKAIYWVEKAEETIKKYTENSFEHYIDIITFKCNLLYEIDRKQASEYAQNTYNFLYHEYDIDNIKVQAALLILKSNFNFTEYKKDADTLLEKYSEEKDIDKIIYLWAILKENYYHSNILDAYLSLYKDVELNEDNIETLEKLLFIKKYILVLGDKEATIAIYNKLYEYYKNKYGIENQATLYVLAKLRTIYVQGYSDERGIDICNIMIETNKKMYGEDSINTITEYQNLRYCYYVLEKYEESVEIANKIIELCEKYMPNDIEDIIIEKEQIAIATSHINHNKAIELEQELLTTYSEYYKKNLNKYYKILRDIGINKSYIEDIEVKRDGINDTLKVYEYLKKTLPEGNAKIREVLKDLKKYYDNIKDYENSIKYCKELCDILDKYQHHSREHLKNLSSLANEYLALEDYQETVKILNAILPLYQQEYGNEDEYTILIMKAMVGCYKKLNQHQRAIDFVLQEDILSGDSRKEYTIEFFEKGIKDCFENKDYENEFLYAEQYYLLCREEEDTEELLKSKMMLMTAYSDIENQEKALSLARELETESKEFYIDCNNENFVVKLNNILYIYLKYNVTNEMIRIAEELKPLAEKNCDHESSLYKKIIAKCDKIEKIKNEGI